nr:HAMP domain-containing sensor histidine kinase [Nocardioides sp. zg-1230]
MTLGWWAVRPALRPVEQVAGAVAAVASGDLRVRIDPRGDASLRLIAESFNSTVDALERRVRMDAKFAADVSHELRSPLTTMVNTVHLVERYQDSMDSDGQEALGLLRAEVDGFQQLVQDLLDISRSDAGSDRLAMVELRLAELVERALPPDLLSRVEVTSGGASAVVRGDKRRLRQALMNLVANAELHGAGVTAVRVDATEQLACLTVEDAGPGLDVDELERIFDRFSRGRGSERGSTTGAGLGLALVAQHVRLMDGTVSAENRPTGGARFVIRLPRSTTEAPPC